VKAPVDRSTPLAAPVKGFMTGRIEESMTSQISLTLTDRRTGTVLFNGEGRNTCIEISGNTDTLF